MIVFKCYTITLLPSTYVQNTVTIVFYWSIKYRSWCWIFRPLCVKFVLKFCSFISQEILARTEISLSTEILAEHIFLKILHTIFRILLKIYVYTVNDYCRFVKMMNEQLHKMELERIYLNSKLQYSENHNFVNIYRYPPLRILEQSNHKI